MGWNHQQLQEYIYILYINPTVLFCTSLTPPETAFRSTFVSCKSTERIKDLSKGGRVFSRHIRIYDSILRTSTNNYNNVMLQLGIEFVVFGHIWYYIISFANPFDDNNPLHRASCRPRNVTGLFASIFYRGSKLIYVTGPHNKGVDLRVI